MEKPPRVVESGQVGCRVKSLILLALLLPGCAVNTLAVPETVAVEAGTSIHRELGERPDRSTAVNIKAVWRLR